MSRTARYFVAVSISLALHCSLLALPGRPRVAPIPTIRVTAAIRPAPAPPAEPSPAAPAAPAVPDPPKQSAPSRPPEPAKHETRPRSQSAAPPKPAARQTAATQTKPQAEPQTDTPPQGSGAPSGDAQSAGHADASAASSARPRGEGTAGGKGRVVDVGSLAVKNRVVPEYPAASRRRRDTGTAVLLADVEGGRVVSVRIESSSGHAPLDESAIRAARRWTFDTGSAERVTVRIPFTFRLR